jgi:hypothetical protein
LPAALEEIKRRDLAITLKDAFEAADLRSSAVAAKADWATEPAQSGGSPSRRPRRHLTWAALVLSMVLVGIAAFVVQLSPDGLTHEGFDVLPTGSPTGGPTATPSEDHVGGTPDATTTRTPTRTTSDSPPPTTSTAWVNGECYGRPELHRGDQVGLSACDSVGGGTDLTFDGVGIVVRSDIVTKVANSRGNRAATGYSTCSGIFNPSRLPASSPITGAACLQSPQYYGYVDVVEVNATRAIVVVMSWARKDI